MFGVNYDRVFGDVQNYFAKNYKTFLKFEKSCGSFYLEYYGILDDGNYVHIGSISRGLTKAAAIGLIHTLSHVTGILEANK